MDKIIEGFLSRNLPKFKDRILIKIINEDQDYYAVSTCSGKVNIVASNYISAFNGLYVYLQKYCNVQLSWCGNRTIDIDDLTMFDGEITKTIDQQYRVYMNYCTLNYSMSWWNFDRWEKEIDFMAMNGINMPLAVVGSEAVLYETLLEYDFSKEEALSTITGPAFYAWQLMTNIDGYLPPKTDKYVYERLELGRKLLKRYEEFGMYPIQQGFSGFVPIKLKEKRPNANIVEKKDWCYYPKTAQLDPLDPLFYEFGMKYLKKLERLFGNYHYIACDPFHEGTPPDSSTEYLNGVGKSINKLYEDFDANSTWVMQGWTPYKDIILAVPKDRLLILDLSSDRYEKFDNFYGYRVVAGMLHNFGGKNAMQGQIRRHTLNAYKRLGEAGVNVVGAGMFMEGIEQNPVVYDLQFHMLTESEAIDYDKWLTDYIKRRYGKCNNALLESWKILMNTCYSDSGYKENEVGSTVAARPQLMPVQTGPCCYAKLWYKTSELEKALLLFASVSKEFENSDGYQYDLCDIARQVLSNRFHDNQKKYKLNYYLRNKKAVKNIAEKQLDILNDMDELLSHRSEMCFSRWICDSHKLAVDDEEKKYFDRNARTLVTIWGPYGGDISALYDYSWREWSGLIKEYYYPRWEMFYNEVNNCLDKHRFLVYKNGNNYGQRKRYKDTALGKKINDFEMSFGLNYSEYEYPKDSDVIESVQKIIDKWIKK